MAEYFGSTPEALSSIHAPIFEDKVIDFIVEMADVSEKVVSLDDLYSSPEDLDEKSMVKSQKKKKKDSGKSSGRKPAKKKQVAKTVAKKKSE